ncbi:hypothetical protein Tsubulata_013488 [Turnera subulata]|uniref:SAC domain-containing protein n=1 Tax=Turnera subulata TaxID=218843 RepID=A0A9Q0FW08_9ROSI|nr:hypothetical protein Tsubulata_013488 [Turnera subulata]
MELETSSSSSSSPPSSPPASGRFKLYDQLELREFPDKYVIKSLLDSPNRGFSISRHNGDLEPLTDDGSSDAGAPSRTSTIYGVAGTIRLVAGTYLLVITSRKEVGAFLGFPVFRIESMRFLSCNEALKFSTAQEKKDEAYFLNLLKTVETTPGLYYSYETDITVNLQRRLKLAAGWMAKPIWKQVDPRFVWNKNLLDDLIESKERECGEEGLTLKVRGSIPLLWEQIVDLSYKPRLSIINHDQTSKVVERHFYDLSQRYGNIIAVDLTNKHGDEGQLSSAYAAEMQKLPNVRYVPFDFHHFCGNSNFDNLKILYDQVSDEFEKQGYLLVDAEGNILEEQKGTIRSNCIDCLDRTNVTQNYLAQQSLTAQLQRIGAFTSTESISMFEEDYGKFRTLWAEQGDEISLEYAGTHALKGDLDALDLVSGRYNVNRNGPSPFQLNGFESLSYLPVASALLLGGLTITSVTLHQAGRNAQQYVSTMLWAGLTAGVMAIVKANGRQFCSRPRLCGLI